MTVALRKTVADTAQLCQWAAPAPAGDFVVYHIGNLGRDRSTNAVLHGLADTVLLFQEHGYLAAAQYPMRLASLQGWAYIATRTRGGWAPRNVLNGVIDAKTWRALNAVHHRDSWVSAHRSIRDTLSCPDDLAADILAHLHASGWVVDAVGKGWCLSPAGIAAMT